MYEFFFQGGHLIIYRTIGFYNANATQCSGCAVTDDYEKKFFYNNLAIFDSIDRA